MQIIKLIKYAYWLISVRWASIFLVYVCTYLITRYLHISLHEKAIYYTNSILLLLNIINYIIFKLNLRAKRGKLVKNTRFLINFQFSSDFIILTVLLHFSGGIENPLIIIYIFHIILSSILLTYKQSFLQTSFALICIGAMTFLEYLEIVPHYPLKELVDHSLYLNIKYLFWTGIIFIAISYLVMSMTSYITKQSRQYEEANRIANYKLMEKDRVKNEYVFKLTHDIKGHLAAILSCLDILNNNIYSQKVEIRKEFTSRAHKRTHFLIEFVKDLLNLTKMQLQQKIEMSSFNLKESIDKIIIPFYNSAKDKSIRLEKNIDDTITTIYGNQFLIEEAIENLLMNAIDYSLRDGLIKLDIKLENQNLMINISDIGIGIPDKELKDIFNEFYRGNKAKEKAPSGTGMGLAIVNQIVKQHNGTIKVESKINKGTTFKIIIPQPTD